MYEVVLMSRKPEARAFKRWITTEVLPSIRRTGTYAAPQSREERLALAQIAAQERVDERLRRGPREHRRGIDGIVDDRERWRARVPDLVERKGILGQEIILEDHLQQCSPVDGQLGLLDAKPGQSVSTGQRLGQINVLTSFKIKAKIDEHYIDRIRKGLTAFVNREGDTIKVEVGKVYPDVRDGRFEVDLYFSGPLPKNIRSGQSYNIGVQLGENQQAIMIPRGSFYQSTGGQWIYVLEADGKTAVKRNIRIGRQNPRNYEVLEGLKPGEKVIISGYELFGKNDKLILK